MELPDASMFQTLQCAEWHHMLQSSSTLSGSNDNLKSNLATSKLYLKLHYDPIVHLNQPKYSIK